MPRNGKRSGAKAGRSRSLDATKSDFTLYDFAHSSAINSPLPTTGRLKKGEVNAFDALAKKTCGKSMLAENSLGWFERDFSDFDLSDDDDGETSEFLPQQHKENGIIGKNVRKVQRKWSEECKNGGVRYPLDVWFLIGRHIRPEDVATFSAICHCSHAVVHSARFWTGLYKRFYSPMVDLPISLQPSKFERLHGLKSRVIRSLFYLYPPFQSRLRCMAPFESDPDLLEGARCVRKWHQQIKQSWHFYFKFERPSPIVCPVYPNRIRSRDVLRAEANALHNAEENSIVLQVVSPGYIRLPDNVIGQVLIKASVSVGHEMRSHRLKLVFNPNFVHSSRAALTNGTIVAMDPVTNIHVLRWWDPKYPCRCT